MLKSIGIHRTVIGLVVTAVVVTSMIQAQTWESLLGPPKAREVKDIAVNKTGDTLYACDKSVLFRSLNGGSSWASTGVELAAPLVATCKPNDANSILVGIANSIRLNTNGGQSGNWVSVLPDAGTPLRLSTSVINSNRMYLGRQASGPNSSIKISGNGGASWDDPGTYPSGIDVNDIAPYPVSTSTADSQQVWAASSAGVYSSEDFGATWSARGLSTRNITAVAIKDNNPGFTVFVGTNTDSVWYSADQGSNWVATAKPGSGTATKITALRIRNNSEIYAATDAGIYRSTNTGVDWSNVGPSGDNNILSFVIVKDYQDVMYATTAKTVWKTTNAGTSWEEITTGLGRMPVSSVISNGSNYWTVSKSYDTLGHYNGTSWSVTKVDGFYGEHITRGASNGYLYATGRTGTGSSQKAALYRSTNSGDSYSQLYQSSGGTDRKFYGSMIDPENASRLFVWGLDASNNFYRIPDYGAGTKSNFNIGNASPPAPVYDVAMPSSSSPFYAALKDSGVFKCESGGPCTGTRVLGNRTIRSLAILSQSTNTIHAAGPTGLFKSANAGSSWSTLRTDDLRRVIMNPGDGSTKSVVVLTNDGNSIYSTVDGGNTWVEETGALPKPIYDMTSDGTATVFASTENGVYKIAVPAQVPVLVSPENGATDQPLQLSLHWNPTDDAVTYRVRIYDEFAEALVLDVLTSGTSYMTPPLGAESEYSWTVRGHSPAGSGDAQDQPYTFTTGSGSGGITLSVGASQSACPGNYCNTKTGNCHPKLTWTEGQGGPYQLQRSDTAYGNPCRPVFQTIATVQSTCYVDQNVWILGMDQTPYTTYCYRVLDASSNISNVVSVTSNQTSKTVVREHPDKTGIPRETALHPNHPNPFNPITEIHYGLHEDQPVRIAIYDVLGREVHLLVDEHQTAGYKSVTFDASLLPSGVYFYRLTAGSFTDVKKMVLAR